MKRPSLFEGMCVALAATLFSVPALMVLGIFFGPYRAASLLIGAIAIGYVVYLLSKRDSSAGSATIGIASAMVLLGLIASGANWLTVSLFGATIIWLVTSWVYYRRPIRALVGGVLVAVAGGAALWALVLTSSIIWAIWCFLLFHALFPFVPSWGAARVKSSSSSNCVDAEEKFSRAHRAAEKALARMAAATE